MHFDLKAPCPKCPFRTDVRPFLRRARAQEIADGLTRQQQTFPCHLTVEYGDDGEEIFGPNEQHCVGALIILERMNRPNQMMRICERIGLYDRRKLAMDAPVFKTMRAFVAAQRTRLSGWRSSWASGVSGGCSANSGGSRISRTPSRRRGCARTAMTDGATKQETV